MGTSSRYIGPKHGVDDEPADGRGTPNPTPTATGAGNGGDAGADKIAAPNNVALGTSSLPIALASQPTVPFSKARRDFTRFTKTGDKQALFRAISGYVKSSGGLRGVLRRMRSSIKIALGFASLALSFARVGPVEALRRFKLQDLAGKPASEVFERLVDELCHEGGTLDEAVARNAFIDIIKAFAEQEVVNFDQLTPYLMKELLAELITNCIVSKVLSEIGTNSLHSSANDNLCRKAEAALRKHTSDAVCSKLVAPLDPSTSAERLEAIISEIFVASFDTLQSGLEEKS